MRFHAACRWDGTLVWMCLGSGVCDEVSGDEIVEMSCVE